MKTKRLFYVAFGVLAMAMTAGFSSCDTADGEGSDELMYASEDATTSEMSGGEKDGRHSDSDVDSDPGEGSGEQNGNSHAGVVTAAEWNDLDHWAFWSNLMLGHGFGDKSEYWQFYTNNRVAVKVTDKGGAAKAGVKVKLMRNSSVVWETVTDNHGLADCWPGLFQKETVSPTSLTVSIDDKEQAGNPTICTWDSLMQNTMVNTYTVDKGSFADNAADIAFIVDATGSMGDEISFLKNDLEDIIGKASAVNPSLTMRTAALFYRDEGDEYVTKPSNFTKKLSDTKKFVSEQHASGGGDYPEAVHTALEKTLQDLSWNSNARTKLAFLILDAPAHHETSVIVSLQKSIKALAKQGIKIIPVAASGVDKNTEFMLRFFAIATGGTYVFITNDSGVGLHHIEATVGDHEVEQLNNLIIRLIGHYTE